MVTARSPKSPIAPVILDKGDSKGRGLVDYDNDGYIDLFVCNSAPYKNIFIGQQPWLHKQVTLTRKGSTNTVVCYQR